MLEKAKVMQESIAIFTRLDRLQVRTAPGAMPADSVEQLRSVLAKALALIRRTDPNHGALPYVFHMAGATARMLADCEALRGRNQLPRRGTLRRRWISLQDLRARLPNRAEPPD
jgi:hypothetical protein